MITKEKLREYKDKQQERRDIKHELEELEAKLYGLRAQQLTGMPHAQAPDSAALEDLIDRMTELKALYTETLAELYAELLPIARAIHRLEVTERRLIRLRYIRGLTWEQVAVEMNYSWRQVHRIHSSALKHLAQETMEE